MNKLCIIPARGGSKRIPRKNIKDFLGKPIIAYSIEAAKSSKLFEEVMVSTDDIEIADIAVKYGAKVPFIRSKVNADDYASTVDVVIEVINTYKNLGNEFEYACCIYPTAPLVKNKYLIDSFNLLIEKSYDTVFPVSKFSYPIFRALQINENGKLSMIWSENLTKRSQDLPDSYHDAGQFYWLNIPKLFASNKLLTNNSGTIILNDLEVQDIDNEMDWKLAEIKYQLLNMSDKNEL
jgi:N-acylneuraminate cytidylyltransferase